MVVGLSAIAAFAFAFAGQVAKAMMDLQFGFGFITLAMFLVLKPKVAMDGGDDIKDLRITRAEARAIAPLSRDNRSKDFSPAVCLGRAIRLRRSWGTQLRATSHRNTNKMNLAKARSRVLPRLNGQWRWACWQLRCFGGVAKLSRAPCTAVGGRCGLAATK